MNHLYKTAWCTHCITFAQLRLALVQWRLSQLGQCRAVLLNQRARNSSYYREPLAAGSGIPEMKSYLNWVKVGHVVRFRTLITKFRVYHTLSLRWFHRFNQNSGIHRPMRLINTVWATGVLFPVAGGLLAKKGRWFIQVQAYVRDSPPYLFARWCCWCWYTNVAISHIPIHQVKFLQVFQLPKRSRKTGFCCSWCRGRCRCRFRCSDWWIIILIRRGRLVLESKTYLEELI